ncbi:MAG: hypothetical protein V1667_02140 [bacterium]
MLIKKYLITIFSICVLALAPRSVFAEENLSRRLSGYILLQVQSRGEAWYMYPNDQKKYYLSRPSDAFGIMRDLSLGAAHEFIAGHVVYPDYVSGKILLDVEKNGEAYYIYPKNKKAYYLGRPQDAFNIMRDLGLGITDENLNKINTGYFSMTPTAPSISPEENSGAGRIFSSAANAIRSGKTEEAMSCFIPEMRKAVEYTMEFLDAEGKLTLGDIMSGAKLSGSTENKKTYSAEVYFSWYKANVNFYVEKQADGNWLLANL